MLVNENANMGKEQPIQDLHVDILEKTHPHDVDHMEVYHSNESEDDTGFLSDGSHSPKVRRIMQFNFSVTVGDS